MAHGSFCGSPAGPFTKIEGMFTVLMCADCQAVGGHGSGPHPVTTRAQMRAGLDLLPTWALELKAAANRQRIAVMRQRLAEGEQMAACTRSRDWPGWSDKPRSPRSWSRSGSERQRTAQYYDRRGPVPLSFVSV